MKYLIFDTEHGGFGTQSTLLTASFIMADEDLRPIDKLNLKLKPLPHDGTYHVTAEALAVNKIDLVIHNLEAETYSEGREKLKRFLKKHTDKQRLSPTIGCGNTEVPEWFTERVTPVGHNVAGDIAIIKAQLLPNWEKYVSYRVLDTVTIARFLILTGTLPDTVGASLKKLASHFNIQYAAHDAAEDAYATLESLRHMRNLLCQKSE